MKGLIIFITLSIILFRPSFSWGQEQQCNFDPIVKDIPNPRAIYDGFPLERVRFDFIEAESERVIPKPQLFLNAKSLANTVGKEFAARAPKKFKSYDITGIRATGLSISANHAIVSGVLTLERWAKMRGFKCRKLKCRKTTWKTKLFQKTVSWRAFVELGSYIHVYYPPTPETKAVAMSNATPFQPIEKSQIEITVDDRLRGDLNWIERIAWTLIGGFANYINVSGDKLIIDTGVFFAEDRKLDSREALYPPESSNIYLSTTQLNDKPGYRGRWQIFVDSLDFEESESKIINTKFGPTLYLVFALDYDKYNTLLDWNSDPSKPTFNPFLKRHFCRKEVRDEIEDFVQRIANNIAKDSLVPQPFAGTLKELRTAVERTLGDPGFTKFVLESGNVVETKSASFEGIIPSPTEVTQTPGVILAWDNLDSIFHYFDLDDEERICIKDRIQALTGSHDKVRPGDTFLECLSGAGISRTQEQIIERIYKNYKAKPEVKITQKPISPVSDAHYRGWYYCYRNTRLCVGRRNIFWWQAPSKFNARSGRHKGIDVYGDDAKGSTNIFAITDGQLNFSDRDKRGWGNALILPFSFRSSDYLAVYAHLPNSSKGFDGKSVRKGDAIGTSGCSGNSGNGKGECNSYCEWSGLKRTDEHLHFELIQKTETGFEKVDPVRILGLRIVDNKRRFRVRCETNTVGFPVK